MSFCAEEQNQLAASSPLKQEGLCSGLQATLVRTNATYLSKETIVMMRMSWS